MNADRSYVVDTHALVWFLTKNRKLGARARRILESPAVILVPTIVLAEAVAAIEKRSVEMSISDLLRLVEEAAFSVVPFGFDAFQAMLRLPSNVEMHDRMIAATGNVYGAAVLTRDAAFAGIVDTFWE